MRGVAVPQGVHRDVLAELRSFADLLTNRGDDGGGETCGRTGRAMNRGIQEFWDQMCRESRKAAAPANLPTAKRFSSTSFIYHKDGTWCKAFETFSVGVWLNSARADCGGPTKPGATLSGQHSFSNVAPLVPNDRGVLNGLTAGPDPVLVALRLANLQRLVGHHRLDEAGEAAAIVLIEET